MMASFDEEAEEVALDGILDGLLDDIGLSRASDLSVDLTAQRRRRRSAVAATFMHFGPLFGNSLRKKFSQLLVILKKNKY